MKTRELTIVPMNDGPAYLSIHPELSWAADHEEYRMAGGYARIAAVRNEIRRQRPGQVLAFDAMTAPWEFAYGLAHFRELVARLPYPMLAINCYDREMGTPIFPPCRARLCWYLLPPRSRPSRCWACTSTSFLRSRQDSFCSFFSSPPGLGFQWISPSIGSSESTRCEPMKRDRKTRKETVPQ